MENRDKGKLSRNIGSTDVGDVNRKVSSRREQEDLDDLEFGQGIGQSEKEEPGSRKSGSVGSSGMKGSTGSKGSSDLESDIDRSSDTSKLEH